MKYSSSRRRLVVKSAIKAGGFCNHATKRLAVTAGGRPVDGEGTIGENSSTMNRAAKRLVVKTAIKAGTSGELEGGELEGWRNHAAKRLVVG